MASTCLVLLIILSTGSAAPAEHQGSPTQDIVFQPLTDIYIANKFYHVNIPVPLDFFPKQIRAQLDTFRSLATGGMWKKQVSEGLKLVYADTFKMIGDQLVQYENLVAGLPRPEVEDTTHLENQNVNISDNHHREKRQLGGILAGLITGAGFGLYNMYQINQLSSRMDTLTESHNKLVDVVKVHADHLHHLENGLKSVANELKRQLAEQSYRKAFTANNIMFTNNKYLTELQLIITNANMKRLSPSFMNIHVFRNLYNHLLTLATQNNNQLLISNFNDFFHCDVSYGIMPDTNTLHLLLHVPFFSSEDKFFGYRYIPMAFDRMFATQVHTSTEDKDRTYLYAKTEQKNIILKNKNNEFTFLSDAEIKADCQPWNHAYVCKSHKHIYLRQANTTCLGSLFTKDLKNAITNCQFAQSVFQESAYQVFPGQWKIHVEYDYIADMSCKLLSKENMSLYETEQGVALYDGITILLKPGCTLFTKQMRLITQPKNMELTQEMKLERWNLNVTDLVKLTHQEIKAVQKIQAIESDMETLKNDTINLDNLKVDFVHPSYLTIIVTGIAMFLAIIYLLFRQYQMAREYNALREEMRTALQIRNVNYRV